MRGEHCWLRPDSRWPTGSPPRTWRARSGAGHSNRPARITSTCVESTGPRVWALRSLPDHLHVRGEHLTLAGRYAARRGSPPRAWRAHRQERDQHQRVRITSTCVESTEPGSRCAPASPDHLHVRGEHAGTPPGVLAAFGSPPRAWRAPGRVRPCRARLRITSTCVESTPRTSWPTPARPDHLHVRGEHDDVPRRACPRAGSPPRAWRAPDPASPQGHGSRITSTCVESTACQRRPTRRGTDHLHVRGEHPL